LKALDFFAEEFDGRECVVREVVRWRELDCASRGCECPAERIRAQIESMGEFLLLDKREDYPFAALRVRST